MQDSFLAFINNPVTTGIVITVLGLSMMSLILNAFRRSLKTITISYRIVFLGLPRAGKTALIAAMFSEIFSDSGRDLKPVGPETIGRINQFIEMLDSGRPIPPTLERDAFVFRFIYYVKRLLITRIRYEGEVVDFPGEMSENLLDGASDGSLRDDIGLFGKEFYSWIISSRAIFFVIDVGQYIISPDRRAFVARMTSEIRSAWQLLQEDGSNSFRPGSKNVALVFTKMDVARFYRDGKISKAEDSVELSARLFESPLRLGEGDDLDRYEPAIVDLEEELASNFEGLIGFFTAREKSFGVFYVSSYFKYGSARAGVRDLLGFALPRQAILGRE